MSDQSSPTPTDSPQPPPQGGRRRRRWLLVTTVALAAALIGAAANRAVSQHGFGRGHWHGPAGFMGGPFDPARAADRADRLVRHLAIEVDATSEQQEKLRGIVSGAVKDLLPMREKAQAARQRVQALLTQPTIDRAAIEAFRAEQVALADAASKRVTQAIGDAAEVLTAQQRLKIEDHLDARRGYWHRWHRG